MTTTIDTTDTSHRPTRTTTRRPPRRRRSAPPDHTPPAAGCTAGIPSPALHASVGQGLRVLPSCHPESASAGEGSSTARPRCHSDQREESGRTSDPLSLVRCFDCAHAREVPETEPLEWRCRKGGLRGGQVHRPGTTHIHSYLLRKHRCREYEGMD